ncbi:hypothetical protein [Tropicimonas sediminicola]|uniref:Uncharacterized protein n=1 Tax=Tropicimonas sediminicola TaxID=1031541 RepID=A0A239ER76_9RHOB|nr:hypothetical protein [Tropicimonas sediminicola]SNS47176.1 hypothetical protein SAMN05421757_102292 [Tropicimonas sediminicola]
MKTFSFVAFILVMFVVFVINTGVASHLAAPVLKNGETPDSAQRASAFKGMITGMLSGKEILMGYRRFDATVEDGRLIFHGGAFTFEDRDAPETFVPYVFEFDGTAFTGISPRHVPDVEAYFARYDAAYPVPTAAPASDCVNPRPESATAEGVPLRAPILCRLPSLLPDGEAAMIGILYPDPAALPLTDGDATCRGEVRHWQSLPGFEDIGIVFCVVMDRAFERDAYSAVNWMDVIFYQAYGTRLLNMRADRRNFQSIER